MNDWTSVVAALRKTMTIAEIAVAVGVQPSTISELEAGRTKEPRYDTGAKLLALQQDKKRVGARA